MNLADLFESYKDELVSTISRSVSSQLNLSTKDLEKENRDISKSFAIHDPKTIAAVRAYTNASSINELLIKGTVGKYPGYMSQYKRLLSLRDLNCHLAQSHHVYSSMGVFEPTELIRKGVFSTPAFISGSLSLKTAIKTANFRREETVSVYDHLLHFQLPAGFRDGFYIADYSVSPEELEYLIFPHAKFNVMGRQTIEIKGGRRVIWTMIPHG